jgi:DNA modification methylase
MIYQGDCLDILPALEPKSIQCCVTSPPYYGLRDYGTAEWVGGNKDCNHKQGTARNDGGRVNTSGFHGSSKADSDKGAMNYKTICGKCGAVRTDKQIGLEETPEAYVEKLVAVFREVRRVLKDDGTLFLNLGDSYFGSNQTGGAKSKEGSTKRLGRMFSKTVNAQHEAACDIGGKEPADYRDRDCLCESLCDVCRKAYLIGKSRNGNLLVPMQSPSLSLSILEHKELENAHFPTLGSSYPEGRNATAIPDSVNLKAHEDEPPLSSQESMPCLSSPQLRDGCLQKDTLSACPLCGKTSMPCVRECEHKWGCTSGIGLLSGASNHDRLDKSSSCLAYPNLTIPSPNVKYKPKDLIGIPWRVAFALQADGWYLRQDIIWHKPNPMPESVRDRCTKSHEYIFLLTKSARYYYNNEAIGSEILDDTSKRYKSGWNGNGDRGFPSGPQNHIHNFMDPNNNKRQWANKKSVWSITTQPYKEAHFATFPEEIPRTCILAGSKKGDTILDPFSGAGTTGVVAEKLNRKYIGIELNPQYTKMAEDRIYNVQPLFAGLEL